jgi:membrane-associated phospholipid phosphatase
MVATVSVLGLLTSWMVAVQRPVPGWELDLTLAINDVPDLVASVLYPIMQLGTIAAPLLVALVVLVWRRDLALATAAVVAGFVAWFGAKGIKKLVERGRPLEFVPGLNVREGTGTGLGFVSGHSAVAATSAVVLAGALPPRARPALAAVAAVVGIARIVHGVHLPADVVGGWSLGTLIGLAALAAVDRLAPRTSVDPSAVVAGAS